MYFEHVLRAKTSETSGKRRDGYDRVMGYVRRKWHLKTGFRAT